MKYPVVWVVIRGTDLRVVSVHTTRKGAARAAAKGFYLHHYRKVTLGRRLANGEYVSAIKEEEEPSNDT